MTALRSRALAPGAALLLFGTLGTACGDGNETGGAGSSGTGGSSAATSGSGGKAGSGTGGASTGGSGGKAGGGSGGASTGGTGGASTGGSGGKAGGGSGGTSGGDAGAGGDTMSGPMPVDLGSAEEFVIIAKSAISTVPASAITGNLAVSPAAASYITGFSLTADSTNVYSSSSQVTGRVYAADYASPTPSDLTTAVGDMELAFTDAAGRPADVTELGAGDIGGRTITPGVYKWGTGLLIPSDVTLSGNRNAVWIFQVAEGLTVSNAVSVLLEGGAVPENIFWQVSGQVELGTTSHFEGIVLSQTSITLATGASVNGRLLAQTAVSLDETTLTEPE